MKYHVSHCPTPPVLTADWDAPAWASAEIARVASFRPESSAHRPEVTARLMWDEEALHGIFLVRDRYVRCLRSRYFDDVWKDSCVEFFVEPQPDKGYFNFEFNCGGAHLCNYITDPTRGPGGSLARAEKLPPELGQMTQTRSTLPPIVEPEITEPVVWTLQFRIPLRTLEHYVGPVGPLPGRTWRANFFKCGDETSHPHWASWAPVDELNFHLPRCFGTLVFRPPGGP